MARNETINSILSRRSTRNYTSEPVSNEDLQEILNCGLWAPSGMNAQTTMMVAVHDRELLLKLHQFLSTNTPTF